MQKNEAYGNFTVSTSRNDYEIVQAPRAHIRVDSNLPANNKPKSKGQRRMLSWGLTTAAALLVLVIAVVGVILGIVAVRSNQTLQQELFKLKELASTQNGEELILYVCTTAKSMKNTACH